MAPNAVGDSRHREQSTRVEGSSARRLVLVDDTQEAQLLSEGVNRKSGVELAESVDGKCIN
jgi:hypothetical protein